MIKEFRIFNRTSSFKFYHWHWYNTTWRAYFIVIAWDSKCLQCIAACLIPAIEQCTRQREVVCCKTFCSISLLSEHLQSTSVLIKSMLRKYSYFEPSNITKTIVFSYFSRIVFCQNNGFVYSSILEHYALSCVDTYKYNDITSLL